MKLGNRKVVIGGLTAIAFTSLTAFTNVTPDTTSDTNPFSATPSVEYQSLTITGSSGIGKYSSLFMPGKVTTTLDTILVDSKTVGSKNPVKLQAGIAKVFTQSVTLDALETVVEEDSNETQLSKSMLNNDSVFEEADQHNAATQVATTQEVVTESETKIENSIAQVDDTKVDDSTKLKQPEQIEEPTKVEESSDNESKEDINKAIENAEQTQTEIPSDVESFKEADKKAEEKKEKSEWDDKVMADVEESVNIRAEANEEAEIVGKFYKGAEANILEKGDEWTKISSGSVTEGYIKNEFLAFGEEAEALAEQDGQLIATVNTDALRIRSEASEEGKVLDLAENGEQLTAVNQNGDWVEIEYTSDSNAFVASEFVSVDYVLGKAITIEEEKAIQEEKKRKEAEARMAEIAASEDAALLAAVVRMEAGGESYEGKLAVASVVVNRVKSGRYPNSVSGVVYQSGQFPGAGNGTLAGFLSAGIGGDCKKAAVEALAGLTNIDYLHFNAVSRIGTDGYVIGNHCFY
ncbi:cell wall hydrolase [Candidatus Galacturonibacter soehngenii]|uniref:SH3 domain-containing protein n=1 Tax=Candidatus Galacturonatibacter soehngenii TaxID=2307010 RepID=A0A7V7QKW6_9FIRM|nr:cell wall hydrolase [Candidatus Galacturonibacter soehngenii]KAB1438524.1 SH3 domain-containing protein [Candidatus Galacturonibacter soehngenii]